MYADIRAEDSRLGSVRFAARVVGPEWTLVHLMWGDTSPQIRGILLT